MSGLSLIFITKEFVRSCQKCFPTQKVINVLVLVVEKVSKKIFEFKMCAFWIHDVRNVNYVTWRHRVVTSEIFTSVTSLTSHVSSVASRGCQAWKLFMKKLCVFVGKNPQCCTKNMFILPFLYEILFKSGKWKKKQERGKPRDFFHSIRYGANGSGRRPKRAYWHWATRWYCVLSPSCE